MKPRVHYVRKQQAADFTDLFWSTKKVTAVYSLVLYSSAATAYSVIMHLYLCIVHKYVEQFAEMDK